MSVRIKKYLFRPIPADKTSHFSGYSFILLSIAVAVAPTLGGTPDSWNSPVSGNWTDGTNWSDGIPGSNSDVVIGVTGSPYNVTYGGGGSNVFVRFIGDFGIDRQSLGITWNRQLLW